MAKSTTTLPIPIGTATGRSDHSTNTGQPQQTTTLRMCRADPDPPGADGLLCRAVVLAFCARTTHGHRIGNDGREAHSVTFAWKADMNQGFEGNTFLLVIRTTMSIAQRFGTAAFVVVVAGLGLGSSAEAHSEHEHEHEDHHHVHRVYAPVQRRVVVAPSRGIVRIRPSQQSNSVSVRLGFNL